MLATIILDAYKENETTEIKDSLEEFFSAENALDWSSAGIYCYWDYTTKEILYFGLAIDLFERFKQHNGFSGTSISGCKYSEIKQYFSTSEKLGFSIMVQSSLSQPWTSRLREKYRDVWELNPERIEEIGKDGKQSAQFMEGSLINAYKINKGYFPKWNKIGGSQLGQLNTTKDDWRLVQRFVDTNRNSNNALSSLREMNTTKVFSLYESQLHGIRISPMSLEQHLKYSEINGYSLLSEVIKSGYLEKELKI